MARKCGSALFTLRTGGAPYRVRPMKPTPFYRWEYVDPDTGARTVTAHMDAADVSERFPGAVIVPGTLEWRNLPTSMDEWEAFRPVATRWSRLRPDVARTPERQ